MEWEFVIGASLASMVIIGGVLAITGPSEDRAHIWLKVVVGSVAAMPVAIVLHSVTSAVLGGEESVFFLIALIGAPAGFAIGTLGAGLALARAGRRWTGTSLVVASMGMVLFALYGIFALIITSIEGRNPPYQATVQDIVLPVSVALLAGGALSALGSLVVRRAPFGN